MTAFSSTADAIGAMKDGAYDYITKPFKLDEVAAIIRRALEARRIKSECQDLRQALKGTARIESIVGTSPVMARVYELIRRVAGHARHGVGDRRIGHRQGSWWRGPCISIRAATPSPSSPSTAGRFRPN